MTNLEKSEELRQALADCYLSAIKNVAHYAIELDDQITGPYKTYVNALVAEVEKNTLEALQESRSTLRGLLRDYRDKASGYLNQLREELANTANALQRILDTLSQSEGDHEIRMRQAVRNLCEISSSVASGAIGPSLRTAVEAIEQSLDQMRQQQQVTIAQFLVEINLLHKRIDALESAVSIDDLTKLFTRAEVEHRIRSAPSGGSLLLLSVHGLCRADTQLNLDMGQALAGAFTKRLRNSVLPNALIGRWSPEEFIVILPTRGEEAMASGKWISGHLSGAYACLQGGKTVRSSIQVNVAVLDFAPEEAERTLQKIGQFLNG